MSPPALPLTVFLLEGHRCWLTRRQCITLVVACRGAQGEAPPLKVAPPVHTQGQSGSGLKAGTSPEDAAGLSDFTMSEDTVKLPPPQLARMVLRKTQQGLRLSLTSEDAKPVSLLLKPVDQLSLLRTLRHLATRAQWDLDAAESRAATNAVLNKARRLH